jgi:hypothetical protein
VYHIKYANKYTPIKSDTGINKLMMRDAICNPISLKIVLFSMMELNSLGISVAQKRNNK